MTSRNRRPVPNMASQRGIALLVVLILLLIMTLLGLASLRGTLLGERMSGNLFDRSLAFQSAESALRQGEAVAAGLTAVPTATDCSNPGGVCGRPASGADRSLADDGWVTAAKIGTGTQNDLAVGTASDLQYLVEYLGEFPNWYNCDKVTSGAGEVQPGCMGHRYRISARYKADGRSQVLLQSVYRRY